MERQSPKLGTKQQADKVVTMHEQEEASVKAAKKSRPAAVRKGSARQGKAQLRKAAGEALTGKSKEIADSLAENAAKGNIQSTRLLLELSELPGAKRKKKSAEATLGKQWSEEPEWNEEDAAG